MNDHLGGYTVITCSGNTTVDADVFGNVFTDPNNDNMRHATGGHETGHALSIGHIDDDDTISLM